MNRRDLLSAAALTVGAGALTKATSWLVPELDEYEVWMVWAATGTWAEEHQAIYDADYDNYSARIAGLVDRGLLVWRDVPEDHWMRTDHDVRRVLIASERGKATLDRMGFESDRAQSEAA
jgi:hypothetical protein